MVEQQATSQSVILSAMLSVVVDWRLLNVSIRFTLDICFRTLMMPLVGDWVDCGIYVNEQQKNTVITYWAISNQKAAW
jgi:hypothetical protein